MSEATTAAPVPAAPAAPVAPSGATVTEGEGYAQAQLSDTQSAALKEVANLRIEYGKAPSDAILQKMGALARFALAGGEKPADFMPAAPLPPDLSEYDPMSGMGAPLSKSMSSDELAHFKSAGTIRGLSPAVSGAVSSFVQELAMPKVIADQILERALKHYGADFEGPALTNIEPLSPQQEREYHEEASRGYPGGADALNKLTIEVREGLKARGLLDGLEKRNLHRSSLAYDARTLHALRLWLQTAPARA